MPEVIDSTPQEPGKIVLPVLFPESVKHLSTFPEYGKRLIDHLNTEPYLSPGLFFASLSKDEINSLIDLSFNALFKPENKENKEDVVNLYFLIALIARGEGQTDLTGEQISLMGDWFYFLLTVEILRRITNAPIHIHRYSLFEFDSFFLKGWTLQDLFILWQAKGLTTLKEVFQGAERK